MSDSKQHDSTIWKLLGTFCKISNLFVSFMASWPVNGLCPVSGRFSNANLTEWIELFSKLWILWKQSTTTYIGLLENHWYIQLFWPGEDAIQRPLIKRPGPGYLPISGRIMWPLIGTRAFLAWTYRYPEWSLFGTWGPWTGTCGLALCLNAVHKRRHAIVVH